MVFAQRVSASPGDGESQLFGRRIALLRRAVG
jgi:hypothetical protein